jgi:hypothetical protein
MRNGFHLHQGGRAIASRPPQPQQAAPLKPTRELILDLFLDHWTVPEIAMRTHTCGATVLAVVTTYMEQFHRQSVAGKADAAPWLRERYNEIEHECWSEYGMTRRAA